MKKITILVAVFFGCFLFSVAESATNNLDLQGGAATNHGYVVACDTNGFPFTTNNIAALGQTVSLGQLCGINPTNGLPLEGEQDLLPMAVFTLDAEGISAGTVMAGEFIGDGSGLTNLPGEQIDGELSVDSLPTSGVWDASGVTISNLSAVGLLVNDDFTADDLIVTNLTVHDELVVENPDGLVSSSSNASPAALQGTVYWYDSGSTTNGEAIFYNSSDTYAYWYDGAEWIISTNTVVGGSPTDCFRVQDYPDAIHIVYGYGSNVPFIGFENGSPSYKIPYHYILKTAAETWEYRHAMGTSTHSSTNYLPPKTGWSGTTATFNYELPAGGPLIGYGAFTGEIAISIQHGSLTAGQLFVSEDVTVGGNVQAGSFTGDGSGLTNLNVTNLTGTINYTDLTNTPVLATIATDAVFSNLTVNTGDIDQSMVNGLTNDLADKVDSSDLAQVAMSGSYTDLTNTPVLATIATDAVFSNLTVNTGDIDQSMVNGLTSDLADKLDTSWTTNLGTMAYAETNDYLTANQIAESYAGIDAATNTFNGDLIVETNLTVLGTATFDGLVCIPELGDLEMGIYTNRP